MKGRLQPPEGHSRWTIRLLADTVVELNIVQAVHFNTVERSLKKTNLEQKAFIQSQISLSLACSSPAKSDNRVVQMKCLPL